MCKIKIKKIKIKDTNNFYPLLASPKEEEEDPLMEQPWSASHPPMIPPHLWHLLDMFPSRDRVPPSSTLLVPSLSPIEDPGVRPGLGPGQVLLQGPRIGPSPAAGFSPARLLLPDPSSLPAPTPVNSETTPFVAPRPVPSFPILNPAAAFGPPDQAGGYRRPPMAAAAAAAAAGGGRVLPPVDQLPEPTPVVPPSSTTQARTKIISAFK